MSDELFLYVGEALGRYGFGGGHPFSPLRQGAFLKGLEREGLVVRRCEPCPATREEIERFHTEEYVARVIEASRDGVGYLDGGDTPAFPGVYEAAATVVGSALDAARRMVHGECRRAFVPIAGLHHARRDSAAGFCVFNDCGVVIESLLGELGLERIAYVDIDAHHGDGVFYGFEAEPRLIFADMHEDGRFLYPGSGTATERGRGAGEGVKLNIPMMPGSDDTAFHGRWPEVEALLEAHRPQFIILQCGADSVAGDPLTHMRYSAAAHGHAAARLRDIADRHAEGRLLALGGGGYNLDNIADAWCAVARSLGPQYDVPV